jgi:hypothetical protein
VQLLEGLVVDIKRRTKRGGEIWKEIGRTAIATTKLYLLLNIGHNLSEVTQN